MLLLVGRRGGLRRSRRDEESITNAFSIVTGRATRVLVVEIMFLIGRFVSN